MRFIINSQLFLKHLSALNGVISNNNTVPIIACFHLHLENNILTIKATDLETTMVSKIELENARVEGIDSIAVTYGYGDLPDMRHAGATHTADTAADLAAILGV